MSDAPTPSGGSADPSGEPVRFTLRAPTPMRLRFVLVIMAVVGLLVSVIVEPIVSGASPATAVALLVLSVAVPAGIAVLVLGSRRKRAPTSIEVLSDSILLPTPGTGHRSVSFRDIRSVFLQKRGRWGFLYIATAEREVVLPLGAFSDDDANRLRRLIRERIAASGPDGERRLAGIDRMSRVADRAFGRRPVVTWATLAIMIGLHGWLVLSGHLAGVLDAASFGAVSPALVEAAGPYLVMTSSWVHAWPLQPFLLLPGLLVVGSFVERLLGHGATALSIMGAILVGGLGAAYMPGAPLHAGATIPFAGLAGTLAFTGSRFRGQLPIGFRLTGQWWGWVATLAAVAIIIDGVSVPGVLLGGLAGVVVGALVVDEEPEVPLPYSPRWTGASAGVLILLNLGAAVWAIEDLPSHGLELERVAVTSISSSHRLNEYAWSIAIGEKNPGRDRLELALAAAKRGVGLEEQPLFRTGAKDTVATVLHRLGRASEAAALERALLEEHPSRPTFATQLARFVDAAPQAELPILLDGAPAVRGTVEVGAALEDGGYPVTVKLVESATVAAIVYAPLPGDEGLVGLLRLSVPAGETETSTVASYPEAAPPLPEAMKAEAALIAPGRAGPRIWPMIPDYLTFP